MQITTQDMKSAFDLLEADRLPEGFVLNMATFGVICPHHIEGCLMGLAIYLKDPGYWRRSVMDLLFEHERLMNTDMYVESDQDLEYHVLRIINNWKIRNYEIVQYWNDAIKPLIKEN